MSCSIASDTKEV